MLGLRVMLGPPWIAAAGEGGGDRGAGRGGQGREGRDDNMRTSSRLGGPG